MTSKDFCARDNNGLGRESIGSGIQSISRELARVDNLLPLPAAAEKLMQLNSGVNSTQV